MNEKTSLLEMTTTIVTAYLSNNSIPASSVPSVIETVYQSIAQFANGAVEIKQETAKILPAVPIKKSVSQNAITCLECGKKLKMLKRHIGSDHNMTVAEYRTKWNLPPDYPVVAPHYAAMRSVLAKEIGLGRVARRGTAPVEPPPAPEPVRQKRAYTRRRVAA